MTQPLAWNNAGDHVYPCTLSVPGTYSSTFVHCSCDLPDRLFQSYMTGGAPSYGDVAIAIEERSRRRDIIDRVLNEAIDSLTHTRR